MSKFLTSLTIFTTCLLVVTGCTKSDESGDREAAGAAEQGATVDGSATIGEEIGEDERVEEWTVAPDTYDCVGVAPQQCLKVKRGANADWTLLYSSIVGFAQQPSTTYELKVRIVEVPNPPADGSSERYELVEVLSSTAVTAGGSEDSDAGADAPGTVAAAGAPCSSNADCSEGEMCAGPEGCDVQWTCQPQRPCTRDLRMYCSCRGETVSGSGSCAPEPYAHRGPCEDGE